MFLQFNMDNQKLIITEYCKSNLKKLGFVFDNKLECWIYSFPVRYWKRMPTLFCRVRISRDKDCVAVDVLDTFDQLYPAFYHIEYGCYGEFLDMAKKKIAYKLDSLGIKEKKEDDHRRSNQNRIDRKKEKTKNGHKNKISRRRS